MIHPLPTATILLISLRQLGEAGVVAFTTDPDVDIPVETVSVGEEYKGTIINVLMGNLIDEDLAEDSNMGVTGDG